jgi:hypothetical protein
MDFNTIKEKLQEKLFGLPVPLWVLLVGAFAVVKVMTDRKLKYKLKKLF